MKTLSTRQAVRYFETKMAFTAGPAELDHMIKERQEVNIVDVRRPEDYRKEHIPRAINLPREQWDSLRGLEQNRVNVVYCYSQQCHLATDACLTFSRQGFQVKELEGGIKAWQEYGFGVEGEQTLRRAA